MHYFEPTRPYNWYDYIDDLAIGYLDDQPKDFSVGGYTYTYGFDGYVIKVITRYTHYTRFLATIDNPYAPTTDILYDGGDTIIVRQERVRHFGWLGEHTQASLSDAVHMVKYTGPIGHIDPALVAFIEQLLVYAHNLGLRVVQDSPSFNVGYVGNQLKLFDAFILIQ